MFVPRGYALVVVDVRGTGASFGTRDSFRSPRERERLPRDRRLGRRAGLVGRPDRLDRHLLSRRRGSTFLASTGHPAVKAIAPLFAVWDTYSDHYYPGGVLLNQLASSYDELMVALDHDRRELLPRACPISAIRTSRGRRRSTRTPTGRCCRAAPSGSICGNFRMPDFISEFRFRDDRLPYDPDFGSPSFSPYDYAAGHPSEDVAVYSVSGWMDGAGFTNGAIARYLSLPNRNRHLLLGPWDHGARVNVSPWRDSVEPPFSVLAEMLRFFDTYLHAVVDTGLAAEAPIHYYTMHAEEWRAAGQWPPVAGNAARSILRRAATTRARARRDGGRPDSFKVDFTFGTGTNRATSAWPRSTRASTTATGRAATSSMLSLHVRLR